MSFGYSTCMICASLSTNRTLHDTRTLGYNPDDHNLFHGRHLSSLGTDSTANLAHRDAVGRGVHPIAYVPDTGLPPSNETRETCLWVVELKGHTCRFLLRRRKHPTATVVEILISVSGFAHQFAPA